MTKLLNDLLGYLYTHQHKLPNDAEFCNLWERIHAELNCAECLEKHPRKPNV